MLTQSDAGGHGRVVIPKASGTVEHGTSNCKHEAGMACTPHVMFSCDREWWSCAGHPRAEDDRTLPQRSVRRLVGAAGACKSAFAILGRQEWGPRGGD